MTTAHQNWQSLGADGMYGGYTATGGGGSVVARSDIDAQRMGIGRTPSAEYPDGYLGTIRSRRDDRLLDSLKNRQNERQYQRGVHKGTRIDPADYLWPPGLDPQRGLRNEARGKKTVPLMHLAPPPHLVNDGKTNTRALTPGEINPVRVAQLAHLRPSWS